MKTATWNQINAALAAEGIRAKNILKILQAMPQPKNGVRSNATVYTAKEIFEGITAGYPFSRPLSFALANRVVGRL